MSNIKQGLDKPRIYEGEKDPQKWRDTSSKLKYGNKIKTHISIDAHLYLIARKTGNISAFLNRAAKAFLNSSDFREYLAEWAKKEDRKKARKKLKK